MTELGRPALTEEQQTAVYQTYTEHIANFGQQYSLIALLNGQPAGFVSMELRARLNWGTLEAWIPDFIVTKSARGTGVGHALFAKSHQCHRVTLESGYTREVAHQFYEAHGMTNSGYFFTMQP